MKYLFMLLILLMFTGCYTHLGYVHTDDYVYTEVNDGYSWGCDPWDYDPFWQFDASIGYYYPLSYHFYFRFGHWPYLAGYWPVYRPYHQWRYSYYYPHYQRSYSYYYPHYRNPNYLFKDKHRRKFYARKSIRLQRRDESKRNNKISPNPSIKAKYTNPSTINRFRFRDKSKTKISSSTQVREKRKFRKIPKSGKRTKIVRDKNRRTIDRGKRNSTQVREKKKFRKIPKSGKRTIDRGKRNSTQVREKKKFRKIPSRSKIKRPSSSRKSSKTIRKTKSKKRR